MLDILQLRVYPEELEQLRLCQTTPPDDCYAAFTVKAPHTIWPVASWGDTPLKDRINVRGWSPLLDSIADELLIWRPQGGCFVVSHEGARYRVNEDQRPGVEFLLFELTRPMVVPKPSRASGWQIVESVS